MAKDISTFTEKLSKPIAALYKIGGLMLVFVFLGALMTLGGNFFGGTHSTAIMTVGAILTFCCLVLYALPQVQSLGANRKTRDFCEQVAGNWWELVTPDKGTALSWISIQARLDVGTVVLNGRAFDNQGADYAKWDSVASCVSANDAKVFYHWQGHQVAAPEKCYEGFGEITFRMVGGRFDAGDGKFFDVRLDAKTFTTKSFRLRRSIDPGEAKIVEEGTKMTATAALIQKKIKEF